MIEIKTLVSLFFELMSPLNVSFLFYILKFMNNPMVSVCVIAYNSSRFILQTLNSIKSQTYDNIELIISDDHSTDSTLEICREWIRENESRFVRVELLTTFQNSGIAGNCNRALKRVEGEWVKLIAGDDILCSNCITDNIQFVTENPDAKVVMSYVKTFIDHKNGLREELQCQPKKKHVRFFDLDLKHQYGWLLETNPITAPSAFLNAQILASVGYVDERYPFVEDYPLWLKLSRSGIRFYFMPLTTVLYRSDESITRNKDFFINSKYFDSLYRFWIDEIKDELTANNRGKALRRYLRFFKYKIAIRYFNNRSTVINRFWVSRIRDCARLWYLFFDFG